MAQAQNLLCSMHAGIRCLESVFTEGHVSLLAGRTLRRMHTFTGKSIELFLAFRKAAVSASTATGYSFKMLLTEQLTRMGSMRNANIQSWKDRHHLEGLDLDERIILLQWILQKQVVRVRSGFMLFGIWSNVGLL